MIEVRPAECPTCGDTRPTVFIRSDELGDLVCSACLAGVCPPAAGHGQQDRVRPNPSPTLRGAPTSTARLSTRSSL